MAKGPRRSLTGSRCGASRSGSWLLSAVISVFLVIAGPVLPASAARATDQLPNVPASDAGIESAWKGRKVFLGTTAAGVAAVTVWGVANWDYFSRSPHAGSEGWFGKSTDDGGMDKLGHMYTGYVLSHGIAALYEHWNVAYEHAALYGALTSFAVTGYTEFGDSFSDFGFSGEDMAMNALGSLMGYFLYDYPSLSSKVDFRWQIGLDPNQTDFTTDYDNFRFLFAVKLNGFEATRTSWLKHIELHAGYYTEGFDSSGDNKHRHPYVGIGVNLTDLARRHGHPGIAKALNYLQPPSTSIDHNFDL